MMKREVESVEPVMCELPRDCNPWAFTGGRTVAAWARMIVAALMIATTGTAFAQSAEKALPPGHPPMGAAGAMGAGGAGSAAIPAGHPPMGGAGKSSLTMEDILRANPGMMMDGAATRPAAMTGALTIQAIPGTAGVKAIGNEKVTVDLYHRGTVVKQIEGKLDKDGKVTIADVPVMPPVQGLVSIAHGGLVQQIETPELNPDAPVQTVQMRVFETTEEAPAWSVTMQHLIVQWAQDGQSAVVTEMLSATTPGDRAWIGAKGADGKRVTFAMALPAGAQEIQLAGGFDNDVSTIVEGKLVTGSALFPGRSQFRISYEVPAKDGNLELPIAAPTAVGSLRVFLPADDVQVTATGLSGGDAMDMGQGKIRMYMATGLAAGQTANLSIRGIKPAPVDEHDHAGPVASGKFSARNVAMGGAFLMVLGGIAVMLMKKNPAKK